MISSCDLKQFLELMHLFCFCFLAHFEAKEAGDMSTLFDVGGILGKLWVLFDL